MRPFFAFVLLLAGGAGLALPPQDDRAKRSGRSRLSGWYIDPVNNKIIIVANRMNSRGIISYALHDTGGKELANAAFRDTVTMHVPKFPIGPYVLHIHYCYLSPDTVSIYKAR